MRALADLLVPALVLIAGMANGADAAAKKSPVPDVKNMKEIRIVLRPSAAPKPEGRFTTTNKHYLSSTIIRLQRIDWSQKGVGLETVQLIRPDVELHVIEKTGKKHRYQFYWTSNSFIDNDSNRLLETEMKYFRTDLIGEMIRKLSERKKPAAK